MLNNSVDDEYDLFGKMLAPKLRRIAEGNRASFLRLRQRVNEIVLEVENKITVLFSNERISFI
jgi:hypothetical protein